MHLEPKQEQDLRFSVALSEMAGFLCYPGTSLLVSSDLTIPAIVYSSLSEVTLPH